MMLKDSRKITIGNLKTQIQKEKQNIYIIKNSGVILYI